MAKLIYRSRTISTSLSALVLLIAASADLPAQAIGRDESTTDKVREPAIEDRIRSLEQRVQQLESQLRQQAGSASGGSSRPGLGSNRAPRFFDASKNSRFDSVPKLPAAESVTSTRSIRERFAGASIYVSFGPVSGPSKVAQVDTEGEILGCVTTPGSAMGLGVDGDRLLCVQASARVGQGQVLAIGKAGELKSVFSNPTLLPDTIALSSNPQCDYYLVGDNGADRVVQISKSGSDEPIVRFQQQRSASFQDVSIASCSDGSLLYWSNDVEGIYRLAAGESELPDRPLVYAESRFGNAVAASPVSGKWVALLQSRLILFDGEKPASVIGYPAGERLFRGLASFVGDSLLAVAFQSGNVWAIDLESGDPLKLFNVRSDRTIGLSVGEQLDWPAADSSLSQVIVAAQ